MIWRFRDIDQGRARQLASDLEKPLKIGEFLAARRFGGAGEVLDFKGAEIKKLPNPLTLTDMDKAVERLRLARERGEMVAICGDYDADGLTAATLLTRGLRDLGHQVLVRVPNRLTEGYGLKPEMVLELVKDGAKLLVTVDNGISEHQAVEAALKAGVEVIITDHHQLPPELPKALAIVNPHRDQDWHQSPPAGVGVAFLLLWALKRRYQQAGWLRAGQGPALLEDCLALVAIGTIADLAPLTGVNRILVHHGLKSLAGSRQPGLRALKKIARVGGTRVGTWEVGFRLAPRLNSAGRLGPAEPALELLMTEDERQADRLAAALEELNRLRYQEQIKLQAEALERCEAEIRPDSRTVVLGGEQWPRGLLGLASSRVAEATGKPTVLFSLDNGLAVGSGRSAGNFNLYRALAELRHLFLSFGGHAQAAGLSLETSKLAEFKSALEELAQEQPDFSPETELWVDLTADSLGDLDGLAWLAALEPFGPNHPAPVVVVPRVKVTDARPTDSGGDQHLKLILSDGLNRRTVVGFGLAPRLCEIGREMDLALTLEVSEYKDKIMPNWRLLDFRPPTESN
ncbi:MAG: single-stranded-DNA-specific exonuclease RecJ [Candidatus Adiutrix sp.]|jgi:single-stranded-DNA-specific exonuclease|nr:single-stranded-DNA-specific exonuclease RecJ [Candidatus Adiutrix sp.]